MEEGEVTLEGELSNWFDDYADEELIKKAAKAIEERVIQKHYIKRADMLEAIGNLEDNPISAPKGESHEKAIRNELRVSIINKLIKGDK